jgi:AcrR family transcriptional regulator
MHKRSPQPAPLVFEEPRKITRGQQRSEEILRIASALFLENGYEKTSIDEVIQQSGGSKAHIYRKFGGKEGLFLASVKHLCDEIQMSISNLDVSNLSAEAGLQKLSLSLARILMSEGHIAFQRLVYAEALRFPEVGKIWFERGPKASGHIFSRFIKKCMQQGQLRSGDSELAASLLCDMLSGHLLNQTWLGIGAKPSATKIKRTADTAVQIFLHGYMHR